jgi:hypothetical protein
MYKGMSFGNVRRNRKLEVREMLRGGRKEWGAE